MIDIVTEIDREIDRPLERRGTYYGLQEILCSQCGEPITYELTPFDSDPELKADEVFGNCPNCHFDAISVMIPWDGSGHYLNPFT